MRRKQFGLALVSARRLSTEVAALNAIAPEILAEAHRDMGGMAALECNRLSHILDTPRTRSMAV